MSYVLGHERYAHSGERPLSTVHLDLDDQPQLKEPPFFKCLTCMLATGYQRATCENQHIPILQDIYLIGWTTLSQLTITIYWSMSSYGLWVHERVWILTQR